MKIMAENLLVYCATAYSLSNSVLFKLDFTVHNNLKVIVHDNFDEGENGVQNNYSLIGDERARLSLHIVGFVLAKVN
jgi:hypothetical protein